MTTEAEPQIQQEKSSYRDLLKMKQNGFAVDDFELFLWRREEELIRSVISFPNYYRNCGIQAEQFTAPLHAVAWKAIQALFDGNRDIATIDMPSLLSGMRTIDNSLDGNHGSHWGRAMAAELPMHPDVGMDELVKDIYYYNRLRLWSATHATLSSRVGKETNLLDLQSDIVSASRDFVYAFEGEGTVEQPLDDTHWNARDTTHTKVVKTGIAAIDLAAGGGIGYGEMLVWGAGTSVGKSTAAQRILRRQGELGQSVLYISCEDGKELMYCKMIADFAEPSVPPVTVRMREAKADVVEAAQARMKAVLKNRVTVLERKKATISQVCREIRYYRYIRNVQLVIIDYLQAITEDEPTINKTMEMTSVVSKLKRCITDCGVAGIVFTQLARDQYKDGAEPQLTSAKHSGEIENETEILVVMWRDAEDVLHAKMPKVKWNKNKRHTKFIIPVNDITGCHKDWQADFSEAEDDSKKNARRR